MKKKLALYNSVEYTWQKDVILDVGIDPDSSKFFVRTSNIVEVDFPMLSELQVNQMLLTKLEAAKEEFKLESIQTMENMEARIQEIRAITYQES